MYLNLLNIKDTRICIYSMPPKKQLKNKVESESSTELEDSSSDEEITKKKIIPKKPTKVVKTESSDSDKSNSSNSNKNNNGFKIEEVKTKNFIDVKINNFNESTIDTLIKMKDEDKIKIYYNKLIHQNEDDKLNFDGTLWQKDSPLAKSLKYMGKNDVHIRSNKKLIEQLTKLCELKRAITKFDRHEDNGYYKVMRYYDDNNSCISITQAPAINAFRRNLLHRLLEPEKSNLLMDFNDLENLKCDVLGYFIGNFINYKIEDRKELARIKDLYVDKDDKTKLSNTKKTTNKTNTSEEKTIKYESKIDIEVYKQKLTEIINNIDKEKIKQIKKKIYYIYKISSKIKKPNNFYIFGTFKKHTVRDIDILIKSKYLKFKDDKFEFIELENIEIYFECEGQLKVDEYLIKENALIDGCNIFYNVVLQHDFFTLENINDRLFLLVNNEIMLDTMKQFKSNNDEYFIACIETPDKYKYIFYEKNITPELHLHTMYNSLDENKKIVKILAKISFLDLELHIIETDIKKEYLEIVFNQIVKKMNKYKLLNDIYSINNDETLNDKSQNKTSKDVDFKKMYFIQKHINKRKT